MKYVVTLELETEEGTTEADIRTALHLHGVTGDPEVKVLSVKEAETLGPALSFASGRRGVLARGKGVSRSSPNSARPSP